MARPQKIETPILFCPECGFARDMATGDLLSDAKRECHSYAFELTRAEYQRRAALERSEGSPVNSGESGEE